MAKGGLQETKQLAPWGDSGCEYFGQWHLIVQQLTRESDLPSRAYYIAKPIARPQLERVTYNAALAAGDSQQASTPCLVRDLVVLPRNFEFASRHCIRGSILL